MIDLPLGATNYLQFFFDKCAVSNETMIWICICTSTCAKQAIRQVRSGLYTSSVGSHSTDPYVHSIDSEG